MALATGWGSPKIPAANALPLTQDQTTISRTMLNENTPTRRYKPMVRGWRSSGRLPLVDSVASKRVAAVVLAGGCILLAGCQNLGTYRPPAWMGSFRPSRPSSVASASSLKPLSAEQKADMQFALGRSAESRGETDLAIQAYREAVKQDDRHGDAYHRLALLYERKGDLQQAHSFYAQALERAPENPELHCDLGYCLYLQGEFPEAEASYLQALQLRPEFARAHINYGLLLGRTGRDHEALHQFFQAGISESQSRLNLAFAMLLENRTEEARHQLLLARRLDRNPATIKRVNHLEELLTTTQHLRRLPGFEPLAQRDPQAQR
ncbi:MAG: tetratricopeptide repeat protein [Planctomycetaceae bacterium]|nr:MAG: tetratricopeptide repeat protein [Planctomycetaceae bacterium]